MDDENPFAPPRFSDSPDDNSDDQLDSIIRVSRVSSFIDSFRSYRIAVDGKWVASVSAGRSIDIPVSAGRHSVVARIDWCGSPTLHCSVDPGETLNLECASNLRGFRILLGPVITLFFQDQYLTLVRG